MAFVFTRATAVHAAWGGEPVRRALARFARDLKMTLTGAAPGGTVELVQEQSLPPEQFTVTAQSDAALRVAAADELGAVYALLYLSRTALGVQPFWFWNEQVFPKKESAPLPFVQYQSRPAAVRWRGWFLNDEVLLRAWADEENHGWEMALEALLRCGGNLVIPGTDADARAHEQLALDMGLWLTHHHAEPLGAELFARAYPDEIPSFAQNPERFRALWQAAVKRRKNDKVVWTIGFRGQGDRPFWEDDPACDTPAARGERMSAILREQYDMVRAAAPDAPICTNLYGEVTALYRAGLLTLPGDVILIWADNGYGRMVSRRQGEADPRTPSLPARGAGGRHGVYYHVSFYDLQAANHITMLGTAWRRGAKELWLINASNVRPHTWPLACVSSLWQDPAAGVDICLSDYLAAYAPNEPPEVQSEMAAVLKGWSEATVNYGPPADRHAGEQLMNYGVRVLACAWLQGQTAQTVPGLRWLTGPLPFAEQAARLGALCAAALPRMQALAARAAALAPGCAFWQNGPVLQAAVYAGCLRGTVRFCGAVRQYAEGADLLDVFYSLGTAADAFAAADAALRGAEQGVFRGFYQNECFSDCKFTAYLIRQVMGAVRAAGDGPHYYGWQRRVLYPRADRGVMLVTHWENHLSDAELYAALRRQRGAE